MIVRMSKILFMGCPSPERDVQQQGDRQRAGAEDDRVTEPAVVTEHHLLGVVGGRQAADETGSSRSLLAVRTVSSVTTTDTMTSDTNPRPAPQKVALSSVP